MISSASRRRAVRFQYKVNDKEERKVNGNSEYGHIKKDVPAEHPRAVPSSMADGDAGSPLWDVYKVFDLRM